MRLQMRSTAGVISAVLQPAAIRGRDQTGLAREIMSVIETGLETEAAALNVRTVGVMQAPRATAVTTHLTVPKGSA